MPVEIDLGCDPGSKNFGYTYLAVGPNTTRIVSCGMVRKTINNLTDKPAKPPKSQIRKTKPVEFRPPFMQQVQEYCSDWQGSIKQYSPVHATCERYQSRGMGGATIEHVVIMLGALSVLAVSHQFTIDFITAATWKFQVNRISDLEAIYKDVSLPDHVVDSAYIALYGGLKRRGIPWSLKYVELLYNELSRLEL